MKYSTDKIEHGLISEYEKIFSDYKYKKINILEIGIGKGGFLKWLIDYFPKAKVVGGDIIVLKNQDRLLTYSDRLSICQLDQADSESLIKTINKYGPFDIIIDDGCHKAVATNNAFNVMWPKMVSDGLYIIEDFIAGYWSAPRFRGMPNIITEIMLKKNELGISDYNIILKEPKCSIAYFKKK